jgi:hypothetical protein
VEARIATVAANRPQRSDLRKSTFVGKLFQCAHPAPISTGLPGQPTDFLTGFCIQHGLTVRFALPTKGKVGSSTPIDINYPHLSRLQFVTR